MPEMCTTDDCRGLARRLVQVEDIGTFPYCQPCADVMVRTSDEDRGPVDLITDEMLGRAVDTLQTIKVGHVPIFPTRNQFAYAVARAVLTSALMPLDSPNTEETR